MELHWAALAEMWLWSNKTRLQSCSSKEGRENPREGLGETARRARRVRTDLQSDVHLAGELSSRG